MRELRSYQVEALEYCRHTQHPVLWVEQRLGKTIVVIRSVCEYDPRRILVVAPSSALRSWVRELALEGETDIALLLGTKRQREKLLLRRAKWNLVNPQAHMSLRGLRLIPWDVLVIDESASYLRYPTSACWKYFNSSFKRVPRRYMLAGRPDPQNTLMAYWPQMSVANGGVWLGSSNFYGFRNRFFTTHGFDWVPKTGTTKRVREELADRCFVLTRRDVNLEIPKMISVREVEMPRDCIRKYIDCEKTFILDADSGEMKTSVMLVVYGWLRQLAGGLVQGERAWSGKMNLLEELLKGELSGEQIVVCFAFNNELDWAEEVLSKTISCVKIDGSVPHAERSRRIESFRSGTARVLLAQVKAIETGEDLGNADTIVYYSLPLDVLSWVQSQDRILGSLEKAGALIVILETIGTVDEDVRHMITTTDRGGRKLMEDILECARKRIGHTV